MDILACKDKISTKVIAATKPVVDYIPDTEGVISYAARVSAPKNQENYDTAERLLRYCVNHSHWSVFEMVNLVVEIKAPRDISRQILRHKTAVFQEFSQRYADVTEDMFTIRECRLEDDKNRQNSTITDDEALKAEWEERQKRVIAAAQEEYEWARSNKIAKEVARVVLPEGNTMSSMYMNANARTWLHYVDLRGGNGTQTEHIWVADQCREAIKEYLPTLIKMIEGE